MECEACTRDSGLEPIPRWKAPLLFVGTLLLCPCHLPVTFAGIAALGTATTGAAWFFGNRVLVYTSFGLAYLALLFFFFRWLLKSRDRERQIEALHAAHEAQA